MPRSVSAEELVFELGYPTGPMGREVGIAVVEARVPVTPLLRLRIPEVIHASKLFGREKALIDPDQPRSVSSSPTASSYGRSSSWFSTTGASAPAPSTRCGAC